TKAGAKQVVIRFEAGGATWCNTGTQTKDSRFDANLGKVQLIMRDPVFGVGVDGEQGVTVEVHSGVVQVSKPAGDAAVVVGPDQQTFVPEGGKPGGVGPITLTARDQARVTNLQPLAPKPSFSRPDASKSPAVADIYKRGVLRVFYESDADA